MFMYTIVDGMKRWVAGLGRLRRSRRASISIEFALVMPPFLLMGFGFLGMTAAMTTRSAMQNNAQLAAQLVATGRVTNFASGPIAGATATATTICSGSLANTTVEFHACNLLPPWATYTVTTTQTCSVPSVSVSIQATNLNSAMTGDRMQMLLGKTLNARAVVIKQGVCT